MKIVKPTGSEDIKLIFRPKTPLNTTITLQTRSKSTNKVTNQSITWVSDENYYVITLTDAIKSSANLVNGTYYEITLSDVDTLLTRETIFVTTQTINQELNDKYNANKGLYKPLESTNEYIILE
jgi:hypothetical protein